MQIIQMIFPQSESVLSSSSTSVGASWGTASSEWIKESDRPMFEKEGSDLASPIGVL